MSANPYRDPRAMRNAIADRLRPLARERGIQLSSLQRQFAYDRLLCRVFRDEPDRWVLKGATAMLARLGADARHTRDIDLLSRTGDLDESERALRGAAALDLGTTSPSRSTPADASRRESERFAWMSSPSWGSISSRASMLISLPTC